MKKLLGLLVVLALALPASADVLKNVEIKGEIQTIASDVNHNTEWVDPITGNDEAAYNAGGVYTRVLAGFSADLVEDVKANVMFQYANAWEGNAGSSPSAWNVNNKVSDYEDMVRVAEANVVLSNLFDCFEATIGRQFYGDEDSAVMYFGPNHYNAEGFGYAPSLDAVKVTYADDIKALTLIAGKLDMNTMDDRALVLAGNNNRSFYGADFRLNATDALNFQVYGYDFRNAIIGDEHFGFYGAKVNFAPEAFLLGAEYARNFSGDKLFKEGKDTGYMVKVDGKVNIEEFAVRGAFFYANENFASFGNYTPGLLIGHALGGSLEDYTADEGVRMFNLGFDVNPFEKWTFALDGYAFQDRFGRHSATWEADLTAKYQHNEYVQLFTGFGYAKYGTDVQDWSDGVLPAASYKEAFNKDNFKWQLGMLINF